MGLGLALGVSVHQLSGKPCIGLIIGKLNSANISARARKRSKLKTIGRGVVTNTLIDMVQEAKNLVRELFYKRLF